MKLADGRLLFALPWLPCPHHSQHWTLTVAVRAIASSLTLLFTQSCSTAFIDTGEAGKICIQRTTIFYHRGIITASSLVNGTSHACWTNFVQLPHLLPLIWTNLSLTILFQVLELTFRSFSGRYLQCLAISTYLSRSKGAIIKMLTPEDC